MACFNRLTRARYSRFLYNKDMDLKRAAENIWEIPKQGGMRVPARLYASDALIESIRRDNTLQQARNVACLPGILRMSYVMPMPIKATASPSAASPPSISMRGSSRPAGSATTSTAACAFCALTCARLT